MRTVRLRDRWWPRPLVGSALLAVTVLGAPVFGRVTSGGKIDPRIDRTAEEVDVVVELPFAARSFHREQLGRQGVYGGRVTGDPTRLRLRSVDQADLEKIADYYWVRSIAVDDES